MSAVMQEEAKLFLPTDAKLGDEWILRVTRSLLVDAKGNTLTPGVWVAIKLTNGWGFRCLRSASRPGGIFEC